MNKLRWDIVALVVPVLLALIAWGSSVESRLTKHDVTVDLSNRVKNLEDNMVPLLVEYKVAERIKEFENKQKEESSKKVAPLPMMMKPPSRASLEKDAKKWAESQIRQSNSYE